MWPVKLYACKYLLNYKNILTYIVLSVILNTCMSQRYLIGILRQPFWSDRATAKTVRAKAEPFQISLTCLSAPLISLNVRSKVRNSFPSILPQTGDFPHRHFLRTECIIRGRVTFGNLMRIEDSGTIDSPWRSYTPRLFT